MIVVKLLTIVTFLRIVRVICNPTNTPLMMKAGIFSFTMKGCTTKEAVVIISCQYNVNKVYVTIVRGHDSSRKAA